MSLNIDLIHVHEDYLKQTEKRRIVVNQELNLPEVYPCINRCSRCFSMLPPNIESTPLLQSSTRSARPSLKCSAARRYSFDTGLQKKPTSSVYLSEHGEVSTSKSIMSGSWSYTKCNRTTRLPPIPKVMILEAAVHHLRVDITRHAQLQADVASCNLLLDGIGDVNDMPYSVRLK